ncbi:hypothetical protein RRG08_027881 [Elysia crispata]|uniref:Uncharacterized protein n=1 Tax=Elysia crispata TaxID=231223 RepID=A0AAE1A6R3_9GAST|nr:hypothetical protein RRG08_027881 [Elysia crispata]
MNCLASLPDYNCAVEPGAVVIRDGGGRRERGEEEEGREENIPYRSPGRSPLSSLRPSPGDLPLRRPPDRFPPTTPRSPGVQRLHLRHHGPLGAVSKGEEPPPICRAVPLCALDRSWRYAVLVLPLHSGYMYCVHNMLS